MIAEYTISDFGKYTKFDLRQYFLDFIDLNSVDKINILNYYSGIVSKPYEPSFRNLKELIKKTKVLNGIIENLKGRLLRGDYWELLENISTIDTSLQTIDNASKWLRSSITKNNFNPSVELDYTTKQFQTLEDVSSNVIGSSNRDQNWISIAIKNDLQEEDYNLLGGTNVIISFENRSSIFIRSVVDNITGEKIYGLDIDRKLSFINDDLTVLSYKETIIQAVDILGSLTQGKTPEFLNDGIQSSLIRGANRNSLPLPIILRQLYNTFSKDDTLKSLTVTKIDIQAESFILDYQVETRFDETINAQIEI